MYRAQGVTEPRHPVTAVAGGAAPSSAAARCAAPPTRPRRAAQQGGHLAAQLHRALPVGGALLEAGAAVVDHPTPLLLDQRVAGQQLLQGGGRACRGGGVGMGWGRP